MTPAVKLLKKQNCQFQVLQYVHDPSCENYGEEAVEKLGLHAAQVFKTLVVSLDDNQLAVAIVPVEQQLDLKQIAKAAKAKKAVMADKDKVMRSTGYVLGGVSPFGQKKRLATFLDESASDFTEIYVSAGKRGLEVAVSPQTFMDLLGATLFRLSK